jgi:hypothetical protein
VVLLAVSNLRPGKRKKQKKPQRGKETDIYFVAQLGRTKNIYAENRTQALELGSTVTIFQLCTALFDESIANQLINVDLTVALPHSVVA